MLELTEHARQHLRATQVPRHPVRLAPFAEVAAHHRGADPVVPRGEEQRRRAAVGEPDHPDAIGVDQRVLLQHVEAAGEVPEVLRERVGAGGDRVHEVEVAPVLVGRQPIGPFPEVAEVGRQHHVPELGEAMRVVAAVCSIAASRRRRGRTPRTCPDRDRVARGRPAPVRCGRSARGGTRAPTSWPRCRTRSSDACTSHARRTRAPRGRAAPRSGIGPSKCRSRARQRSRHAGIACGSSTGHGRARRAARGAASSRPTARSCAPVRSRRGDGTVRTYTPLRGSHVKLGFVGLGAMGCPWRDISSRRVTT